MVSSIVEVEREVSVKTSRVSGGRRAKRIWAAIATATLAAGLAMAAHADDLGDIRATLAMEGALFDNHDVALAPRVYAPDVIWQNPFGVRFHSEAALARFLTGLFQRPGYLAGKTTSPAVFTDVTLLTPTTATACEEDASQGQIDDATGKPVGVRRSHVLYVLQKRNGAWLIVDEMIMDEHER
jgi:ketosteroid isomerase-like protein